jgi:hypothetical protein
MIGHLHTNKNELDDQTDHQAHFLNLMSKTVDKSKVFDLQVKKS